MTSSIAGSTKQRWRAPSILRCTAIERADARSLARQQRNLVLRVVDDQPALLEHADTDQAVTVGDAGRRFGDLLEHRCDVLKLLAGEGEARQHSRARHVHSADATELRRTRL